MIAIVSHDAGGAEILSSFVRRNKGEYLYVLEGPALRIFESKLGKIDIRSFDFAMANARSVLTGTSWGSDLEYRAIKEARGRGIRSCTFLDHWVHYTERLEREGVTVLPDEIWVGDEYALRLAQEQFNSTDIKFVSNPYFADIVEEIDRCHVPQSGEKTERILYVCEPVGEHMKRQYGNERALGYIEDDAIRFFFDNIGRIADNPSRIVIRPHPAESREKYKWVLNAYALPVEIGGKRPLLDEIMDCDIVVGIQSMAMVVGLLAGKKVYSSIPPGGKPCALPHVEIIKLKEVLHRG